MKVPDKASARPVAGERCDHGDEAAEVLRIVVPRRPIASGFIRRLAGRSSRAAVLMLAAAALAGRAVAQQQTVGLFLNDPRAQPGYTLFAPMSYARTYLIDDAGRLVHAWTNNTLPGDSAYLRENGHLLRTAHVTNAVFNAGGAGGRVQDYDWDATIVWDFTYSTTQHLSHHDVEWLPGGNVLMIAWELKTRAQAIAAGRSPALVTNQGLWPDHIIEVQPNGATGGTIVWEWHLWDHLIQDFDPTKANFGAVGSHPELVDLNKANGSGADWTHTNSIDYNPAFDQILLSIHNLGEVWVIDHSTTTQQAAGHTGGRSGKGGDLLYRWGNPQNYRAGAAADQKLFGQHDAQWILAGSPGAGHLSVFNNGMNRPGGNYSTVEELAPPVDANGSYSLVPGSAYGPATTTWTYTATPPASLYAQNISGALRLPNGNTLICDGPKGTFHEVTTAGETVWKYVNPVATNGPLTQGASIQGNTVFKIRRYPSTYPGLAGHDLTPGGTIELGDEGAILRNAVANRADPISLHLPLELVRDRYATVTAGPFVIAGDAAPGAPPIIFYNVPDSGSLTVTRIGADIELGFTF